MARGDDHLGIRLEREDGIERRQPLGNALRIWWQTQIERDDGGFLGAQGGDGASPITHHRDVEIRIGPAQLRLQAGIILHHQQVRFRRLARDGLARDFCRRAHSAATLALCRAARGRRMTKRVPTPSRDSTSSLPPIARTISRAS